MNLIESWLSPVKGFVDGVFDGALTGWVYDRRSPAAGVGIEVYDGEVLICAATTGVERPDVNAARGIDGLHGFSVPLPRALFDDQPHRLRVVCKGRDLPWANTGNYPPQLDRKAAPAGSAARAPQRAAGKAPAKPADVPEIHGYALKENPEPLEFDADASAAATGRCWLAGSFVEGELKSGGGSGLVGLQVCDGEQPLGGFAVRLEKDLLLRFRVLLPQALADGQPHDIALRVAGSGQALASHGGPAVFRSALRGRVETLRNGFIKGWVYDVADPAAALEVELQDAGRCVALSAADILRPDVNSAFGISGAHGFVLAIPAALYDGGTHRLEVRCRGTLIEPGSGAGLAAALTPQALAAVDRAQRYQGQVDQVTAEVVQGWVIDRLAPGRPVEIAVHVDGELAATARANRFMARLRAPGRSGHHGFRCLLPARFMNGKPRTIRVTLVECGQELPSKQATTLFPLVDFFSREGGAGEPANFSYAPPALAVPGAAPVPPQPAAEGPEISVIVLNWNGAGILRELLDSFLRVGWRHGYEILLVDHGSEDDSLAVAAGYEKRLPLRVLARGANYSFAESNNHAAREARGRYLVFANNDLVMLHDCFAVMRGHFGDPDVGAVGVKLLEPLKEVGGWSYATHHQGVQFRGATLPGGWARYYVPEEIGERPQAELGQTFAMPAATAALLMCRKADFEAIGGFHEGYRYGMEDVDLCLALRERLGRRVLCDTAALALHNRSATREAKLLIDTRKSQYDSRRHIENHVRYVGRFGRRLPRRILRALAAGDSQWRAKPLRVTFVVTEAVMSTAAGDFFTAMELAEAMRRLHGWEVMFSLRGNHSLPGTDVLVVMRHDYDIEKVADANPGLLTVAWIRNRVDQWLALPHFDAYDLIFCSSRKTADHVREHCGRDSTLLPIAVNAARFRPREPSAKHASDVVFTGHFWGDEREAIGLQDIAGAGYDFAIYGKGWGGWPEWRDHWRGAVPYTDLPEVYASAKIVLDDSHPVTRDWNSLNSRVFDVLGCGRLVLTNCAGGARELFPGLLPTFSNEAALQQLLRHYLDHPQERELLAAALHQEVLAKHTYDHRAATFRDALRAHLDGDSLRFAIKIGVPRLAEREQWGDYHYALGIRRALEAKGHRVRIDILPDWETGLAAGDDVVIVLRGLSEYRPQPTAINLMWLISHPDSVSVEEMRQYDHVFVASESFAASLQERLGDRVSALLQCTDPAVFFAETREGLDVPEVLFVGNSRGQRRAVVQHALDRGIDIGVYGAMWSHMLPAQRIRGDYLPNETLRHYYSGAQVVLNDHWPDMREQGFVSNRIFDAGACGAAIVSDDVAACRALFGDAIAYYRDADEYAAAIRALQQDEGLRRSRGERLRELIVAKHTFAHRVADILGAVERIDAASGGDRPA